MCIDGISLEVGGKGSEKQFVEDMSMIDSNIRGDLVEAPIGQELRSEIDLWCNVSKSNIMAKGRETIAEAAQNFGSFTRV